MGLYRPEGFSMDHTQVFIFFLNKLFKLWGHRHTRTHMHARIQTLCARTHTHKFTHAHTHARTHTHAYTRIRTHTHAHNYLY
jgi:hypothetical protein